MRNVQGLDHVMILVHDLDDAERRFARLGFHPTPRGVHSPQMGTANSTVMFDDDTYVELLSVLRPTRQNEAVRRTLEAGEGPFGLAFKSDDARAAAAEFAAAGIADGDAVDFVRPVELPEGPRDAVFTIARLLPAATPGSMAFVCQHHTPELVWRQDHLSHPNRSVGVAEVVGVAADLDRIAEGWARVFGEGVRRVADGVAIPAGSASLTFLAPTAFARRFGEPPAPEPRLAALRLRVRSAERLRRHLAEAGVPHLSGAAGSVMVPPAEACGTWLELAEG